MAHADNEDSKFIVDARMAKILKLKEGKEVDFFDLTPKQQRMMKHIHKDGTYDDDGHFTPKPTA